MYYYKDLRAMKLHSTDVKSSCTADFEEHLTLDSETELTLSVRKLTLFTFASSVTENNSMYLIPNMNYLFREMNIHEEKKNAFKSALFFIAEKTIFAHNEIRTDAGENERHCSHRH
jgi:hypothetical protein